MNCIIRGTHHFELAAGKPRVGFAAESCLVLMVCSYSHVPGSALCYLFSPLFLIIIHAMQLDFISPFSR